MPNLLTVPGVVSVARFKMRPLTMLIGGERKEMRFDDEPSYHAMYEVESPEVLLSDAWGEAVEEGRWPEQVRPLHAESAAHFDGANRLGGLWRASALRSP